MNDPQAEAIKATPNWPHGIPAPGSNAPAELIRARPGQPELGDPIPVDATAWLLKAGAMELLLLVFQNWQCTCVDRIAAGIVTACQAQTGIASDGTYGVRMVPEVGWAWLKANKPDLWAQFICLLLDVKIVWRDNDEAAWTWVPEGGHEGRQHPGFFATYAAAARNAVDALGPAPTVA